jgi:hypothetical protein
MLLLLLLLLLLVSTRFPAHPSAYVSRLVSGFVVLVFQGHGRAVGQGLQVRIVPPQLRDLLLELL